MKIIEFRPENYELKDLKKVTVIAERNKQKRYYKMIEEKNGNFYKNFKDDIKILYFLVDKKRYWEENNEKCNIKEYIVLSTMSSGKSTLINALIGDEVLPSENQACTGKIYEITNEKYKNKNKIFIKTKNKELKLEEKMRLKEINESSEIESVKIVTEFKNIYSKIKIYDTPGVNNFLNKLHEEKTYEFMKNNLKNIVYILNATQIGVNDDKKLLCDLKEMNEKFNMIFILNKIDEIDHELENYNDILENVKTYLSNLGFSSPVVIPVVSKAAKLFRMALENKINTRKEKSDFIKYVELYKGMPNNNKKNSVKINGEYYSKKEILKLIEKTGIVEVEKSLEREWV